MLGMYDHLEQLLRPPQQIALLKNQQASTF